MNKTIPFNINHTLAGHDMGFGNSASRALMQGNDIYEEKVDHPSHYNSGKIEAIDAIEDWNLGFHDGNALKYIARHKHKESPEKDIEKAIWYLQRHLENLRNKNNE